MTEPKTCTNGCDAPICPPSTVVCRQCLNKIGDTLHRLLREQETGRRDPRLDNIKPGSPHHD